MSYTHAPLSTFLALAGAAVLAALPVAYQPADAASISLNLPSCSTVTISETSPGSGNYTVNCNTAPTAPGAPTGCVATAVMTPSPLTSSGGGVSLAATCGSTTTSWSWTKNGASFASSATTADTLPANGGSAAVTYTYAVTACNGSACALPVSTTVSVPGSLAPPVTPPPTGPIACAGFAKTLVIDVPWISTTGATRILTSNKGGFGANDAVVLRLTVPAGARSSTPGSLTMAEWGGGPLQRFATLSQTACDFGKSSWFSDAWTGPTLSLGLQVGGAASGWTALLQPGTVYYVNVRNTDRYGNPSCSDAQCNIFIDFAKPWGT